MYKRGGGLGQFCSKGGTKQINGTKGKHFRKVPALIKISGKILKKIPARIKISVKPRKKYKIKFPLVSKFQPPKNKKKFPLVSKFQANEEKNI